MIRIAKLIAMLSGLVVVGIGTALAGGPIDGHKGIFNLGVRIFEPAVNQGVIVLPVHEQGEDLDGDGNDRGVVAHSQAHAAAPLTNLGLTGAGAVAAHDGFLVGHTYLTKPYKKPADLGFTPYRPIVGDGVVAFERYERSDLNGDGDTLDRVAQVMSPDGSVRNLGVTPAGPFGWIASQVAGQELVALLARERDNGRDFNGDGDTYDYGVFVWDERSETLDHFNVQTTPHQIAASGRLVAWSSWGDGTLIWDANRREQIRVPYPSMRLGVEGTRVAFSVPEDYLGRDGNGDGDELDYIAFVFDALSRTFTDTGLAVNKYDFPLPGIGESEIFLPVDEHYSGDLNGDGDAFDYSVLHVFDPTTGASTNLGLSGTVLAVRDDVVILGTSEGSQGHTDLNGDGDSLDNVILLYDRSTGDVENPGLAMAYSTPLASLDSGFVFALPEDGRHDHNGDGDRDDDVLHALDTVGSRLVNLGLAVDLWGRFGAAGDTMVVSVTEAAQGNEDLNGNGQALDRVAFRIELGRELRAKSKP